SVMVADEHFFDFFGVEIIEGRSFSNDTTMNSVYNETAVKELGDDVLLRGKFNKKIGTARDFYLTPTTKAKPVCIYYESHYDLFKAIAYKYEEGKRQQTQDAITQWLRKAFPNQGQFGIDFTYMEDVFQEYFKSERALLKLLSVMTGACVLIAVFGVYSLTSLSCQQRRKEIALRKINGADVLDIMNIFFKESLVLLVVAALFAFPAGYFIMARWLQNYVKQTSMDAWLFVSIFLTVFVVIIFSTVSVVWKAANQNPAEVVKNE
ncbi:MAG: FtsX-like permease family protein, partial [Candidatus Azobacteroides sp.]|nr:FtsX-like permease family protein [Candidatus Azobacteroides sp.]